MTGGLQGEFGDLDIKYLKESVTNIGKLQEKFQSTVQDGCEIISQQKGDS